MSLPIPECFAHEDHAYVPLGELRVYERDEYDEWRLLEGMMPTDTEMREFGNSLAKSADQSWIDYLWQHGWDGLPLRRSTEASRGPIERAMATPKVDLDELRTASWLHVMRRALDRDLTTDREDHIFRNKVIPLFKDRGWVHTQEGLCR